MLKHHLLRIVKAQEHLRDGEGRIQKKAQAVGKQHAVISHLVHDNRQVKEELVGKLECELGKEDEGKVATSRCGIGRGVWHH